MLSCITRLQRTGSSCHAVKSLRVSNAVVVLPVQDIRTAVLLRALEVLPHITQMAGGQFMLRRIQQEAWPILKRLLQADPLQRHSRPVPGDRPPLCTSLLCPTPDTISLACCHSYCAA